MFFYVLTKRDNHNDRFAAQPLTLLPGRRVRRSRTSVSADILLSPESAVKVDNLHKRE